MKNIKHIIFLSIIFSVLSFPSCQEEVLNKEPVDIITEPAVWNSPELIDALVNNLYNQTNFNEVFDEESILINCTDEARTCFGWSNVLNVFSLGILNPDNTNSTNTNNPGFAYPAGFPYEEIRGYNEFLKGIDGAKTEGKFKEQRKAEVRFLRAWTYFNLAMRYGGVPLLTEPQSFNDELYVFRNKEDEIYEFVKTELDAVVSALPEMQSDADYARISKYAALALKSRAMLYAASIAKYSTMKLDGLLGVPSSKAQQYFQESYDASKLIIQNGPFSLYQKYADKAKNYQMLFLDEGNPEIILAKQYDGVEKGHDFDFYAQPVGFKFGVPSSINPYLEMVDAYEFADGKPGNSVNYDQIIDTKTLYENKEPRFHASILYNQSKWLDGEITTHYFSVDSDVKGKRYIDANSIGKQVNTREAGATQTGFIIKKYLSEMRDIEAGKSSQDFIVFRLGEIYLNLAEAAYQLNKPDEALDAVNIIRERGGVALRETIDLAKIKHERKIELAFEGIRFWDLRRWRESSVALTGVFHKLTAYYIRNAGTFGYLIQNAQGNKSRLFLEQHYYMPFHRKRVIENPNLLQNPGYN